MNPTKEQVTAAVKEQVAKVRQALKDERYNAASVRKQVADLAQRYGSPVLDVGTGACACMAATMAQRGLSVMAIDHNASRVLIARERASKKKSGFFEVRHADAAHLPFPDNTYHVVTAFDSLCHVTDPVRVIKEMFRVCDRRGAVIITELNAAGRRITHHLDEGFEEKLPALLASHCHNCQQLESAHHVTFACEKN